MVFGGGEEFKDADYVIGWYLKANAYGLPFPTKFAFVSTNSVAQGDQVSILWSRLYAAGKSIFFAHKSFAWANSALHNAGVHCVIIGVNSGAGDERTIFSGEERRVVASISPYLIPGAESYVTSSSVPISSDLPKMISGNMARDDGQLILDDAEKEQLISANWRARPLVRRLLGTRELVQGSNRWCLWIDDDQLPVADSIPEVQARIARVAAFRSASKALTTQAYARIPHKFAQRCHRDTMAIAVPKNTPPDRTHITPSFVNSSEIVTDLAFVIYGAEPWLVAILSSKLHDVWANTVSGGLGSGLRYSASISYHTFPLQKLTAQNKADLTRTAENILLAREAHFPATIADLYDPQAMPDDLRRTHDENDEVLERIYIGRRFRNDTERLEKLFDLYTKMTAAAGPKSVKRSPSDRPA